MPNANSFSDQVKGIIYGLLSALFLTGYILVNRYVYTTYAVEPFEYSVTFAGAGGLIATLALLFRHVKDHDAVVSHKTVWPLIVVGFSGGLAMALVVFGQNYTTAVNTGIIITTTILTTNLFSKYMLKESFNRQQWLWLSIMFVGLYLGIVGLHWLRFNLGDLIVLSASIAFGFTNTFSKVAMRKFDSRFVADARLTVSAVLMLLIGLVIAGGDAIVTTAGLWPLLAGLSFWLTIRTFYSSIHYINPNKTIVLNNSQVFFTALAGVVLLSEPYGWIKFVGSAVVLVSIYFISKR